jgi:hypothetical protein
MLQELLKPPGRWVSVPRYAELVRQRIRVAARDGRPWLTLAYVFSPRHVVQSYNYHRAGDRDAYRREFARNQSEAAREIDELIATIREVDPGAIVLVFGDHGALMSRGTEYRDDPEFYVLDRHGVRMAIWPGGVCAREIDAASGGGFITVAMAVRAIITCLSDGLDPVDKSVTYSLPYGDRESYGRYLYESGSGAPIASPAPAR